MSYFFRLVDYSIVDFFVQQAEGSRYCRDQFLEHTLYLLCGGVLSAGWLHRHPHRRLLSDCQ